MKLHSLQVQFPTLTTPPSSDFFIKHSGSNQFLKFDRFKRYPAARNFKLLHFRAPSSSGTSKFSTKAGHVISQVTDPKDENLAYVAGATGRVGSRAVRELLKLGFRVRAGVRSAQRAETLVQVWAKLSQTYKLTECQTNEAGWSRWDSIPAVERLELVECDLEKPDQIGPALGNVSVVLCCIGASEKEVFDVTGPYRIDYLATKNLIDAATAAKVNHFILLTSLGTNKVGFPAAILNLFWGVLIWKRKAEETLLASGIPYTIVRPGGMERPTDAYKETHNMILSQEDTLFGGQVSNLQVAELMAFMAKNCSLSYCKVVEVIAETTAPLIPMGELLTRIPSQRAEEPVPGVGSDPEPSPSIVSETSTATREKGPEPSPPVVSKSSTAVIEKEPAKVEAPVAQPLSPYTVYADLKPPTSPSPNAPTISSSMDGVPKVAPVSGNSIPQPEPADKSENKQQPPKLKSRPLSPYTMYEDLKPPTSPAPPKKF
ncbi:NAD(P)-binding domain [Dillenia turbinata]|uniref:NAD(P)-binding domain n=1 Tax=Dillenia turbinata TaxID=194707 RepID=A0AAN8UR94_9MAGN